MVVASIRLPSSLASLSPHTFRFSWRRSAPSLPSYSLPLFRPCFQVRLRSVSAGEDSEVKLSADQSEMIFVGTGTSEGISRVSCLTNPLKNCPVCSKATEPGNKNRRLNTSILIRQSSSSGSRNILVDVGKFFYQSALRWFPTLGYETRYMEDAKLESFEQAEDKKAVEPPEKEVKDREAIKPPEAQLKIEKAIETPEARNL